MKRVLIIGAHPADPIDLAGGTAYQLIKENKEITEVTAICLTYGVYSHSTSLKGKSYDEIITIKKNEFKEACKVLGISNDSLHIDYVDEPLTINQFKVRFLADYIRKYRPHMVITHSPNEYAHWDHSTCGEIVIRALKAAIKLSDRVIEGSREPWYVPSIYFFAVQFRPEVARLGAVPQPPDILIDVTNTIQEKIKAMTCFKSQGITQDSMEIRVESFEGEMGRADGIIYAEGFSLFYPLKRRVLLFNDDKGFYK